MMPTRIVGKPFTCTEINYCPPNRYRAEGGPLLGAYAALQDWDGLFRFAESHDIRNLQRPSAVGGFDNATDPIGLLSERIGLLMFLRGDVAPGKRMIPFCINDNTIHTGPAGWGQGNYPQNYSLLGLYTRIGSYDSDHSAVKMTDFEILTGANWVEMKDPRFVTDPSQIVDVAVNRKLIPADAIDLKSRRVASDTGQIALAADQGTFEVVTDRSECFAMTDARTLSGKAVSVKGDGGFTVICVAAMDGKSIQASRRLLVIHLTDVQNTKAKYRSIAMTLLEQWGVLPHLVRAGKAELTLKLAGGSALKAYSLDLAGKRRQAINVAAAADGSCSLTVNTDQSDGGCMVYELLRE